MASTYKTSSICIIIPMYNEEKVAATCIDMVSKEIEVLKGKVALIIVNDGSTDKTSQVLKVKKRHKRKLVVLTHSLNKGYGVALQTGISYALKNGYEFYLTMDSDLTNPPKDIHLLIGAITKDVDCIKASRYVKGGRVVNVPVFRQVVSIAGNYLASLFFNVGIRDCTNGFKIVRLKLLKGIAFKEKNFSIILEEMYYLKQRHARFKEVPNVLYARAHSVSHFRYKPKIFYDYFKYLIKAAFISG